MRPLLILYVASFLVGAVGCTQSVEPPPLQALERSGKTSLLCREMNSGQGRDIRACPLSVDVVSSTEDRRTFALVTQTLRGEVAAIDMHDKVVIDENPYVPGKEFLPVGKMPTSIVSTPGGVATFVGVAEPGKEAIFALPTTCIMPPVVTDGNPQPAREISLWAACRLPSAPGEMAIAFDTTPNAEKTGYRTTCAPSSANSWLTASNLPIAERRTDGCSANLEDEQQTAPRGRRKLVVTLPDQGLIAIFDAQAILNLPAGSFDPCVPERIVPLRTNLPTTEAVQEGPGKAELAPGPGCTMPPTRYTAVGYDEANAHSLPAGIALSGTSLFVSDLNVPLIHQIDLSDPCTAKEVEPLRPVSYDYPSDAVYTDRVSVSKLLPSGRRYLYATTASDGDAMAFDISPGATAMTPILRGHALDIPYEAPDRIHFESPISDLALVQHDVPAVDTVTETAKLGVLCDPNPSELTSPGTLYRTSSDYTLGAAPRKFRGLFGMMALDSGQIAAVDVEDWDAPCRRPATNNPDTSKVDWLGCANDPNLGAASRYEIGTTLTVTDESSCNVIEPHRVRSGKYFLTDDTHGANSAHLVNYPVLAGQVSQDTSSITSDREKLAPKMLAVAEQDIDCSGTPQSTLPFTFVGSTKYSLAGTTKNGAFCDQGKASGQSLSTDPDSADQNSVLLPLREPRAYGATESFTATYEGLIVSLRENALLPASETVDRAGLTLESDEMLFRDSDAWLCDQGIQDRDVNYGIGKELGLSDADALNSFADDRGDFVVLMSDFLDTDPYFARKTATQSCPADLLQTCQDTFGTAAEPDPKRELLIRRAYHDQLVVAPRIGQTETERQDLVRLVHCCFPGKVSYEVRAANQWIVRGQRLLHDVVPDAGGRCIKDCSPRRSLLKNRAYEISSSAKECDPGTGATSNARPNCFIGPAVAHDVCVVSSPNKGVLPSTLGAELPAPCVYSALKGRFAIYRGLAGSVRDMSFTWTVAGGFSVLSSSMINASTGYGVMPAQINYSESLDALVVVDGESGGLHLFGMQSFAPLGLPYQ